MNSSLRDDFSGITKRNLAARVSSYCSKPDCGVQTSGPQTDASKAINLGVAAHITAASSGGPRYDSALSHEERAAITNGIWLCQNCAKLIDNDPKQFPVDLLLQWKSQAEQKAREALGKTARLPDKSPIWNVPYDRNPNFTGRTELLSGLYDSLHAGNATVLRHALRGLGGVGKTQLALEYAYRHAVDYSVVWWVQSETSPATGFAELTRELGLPEADASESDVRVQAVKRWLKQHEGWLLVFDNATEPDAVKPYLPQGQGGHVIITSRYWDWGDVANGLMVEVFDREEEAVPFLLLRTSQANQSAAAALSEALGDLPLALAQAAAYIASTGITLAEYLELFEAQRVELWQDEAAPEAYPEPVATAWALSMTAMTEESPEASELLRLMAFLAPEPVARGWLSEGAEHLFDGLSEMVTDQLAWNRSLRVFRRYGLVEVNEGTLVMHRLVQAVTRDRLTEEERRKWIDTALKLVNDIFTFDRYNLDTWPNSSHILPHVLAITGHDEVRRADLLTITSLLTKSGEYLYFTRAAYSEAEGQVKRLLDIQEKIFGSKSKNLLIPLYHLARIYRRQSRYKEAEECGRKQISIVANEHKKFDPDLAIALNSLAETYRLQEKYKKAEKLYKKALSIYIDSEDNSIRIATTAKNLGQNYRSQGMYKEAQPLFERALDIRGKNFGLEHPEIAEPMNHLAHIYHHQGNLKVALEYARSALSIRERTLWPGHPYIVQSLECCAMVLRELKRDSDVFKIESRVKIIRDRFFS